MNWYTPPHWESGALTMDNRTNTAKRHHVLDWKRRVQNWWWNHMWHHHHFKLPASSSVFTGEARPTGGRHALTHVGHKEVKALIHASGSFVFTQNISFCIACNSVYTSAGVETGVQGLTGPQPDALIWNKWVRAESNKHSPEQCIQPLCSTWRLSYPLLGQFIKEPNWKKKERK